MSSQGSITFHEVAASFSEEQWMRLDNCQKDVYRNVMKEIHGTLIAQGYKILEPSITFSIKRLGESYVRMDSRSMEKKSAVGGDFPDILMKIKEEPIGETSISQGRHCDNQPCTSASGLASSFNIKQEDPAYGPISSDSSPITSSHAAFIKTEEEGFSIDDYNRAGGEGTPGNSAGVPVVKHEPGDDDEEETDNEDLENIIPVIVKEELDPARNDQAEKKPHAHHSTNGANDGGKHKTVKTVPDPGEGSSSKGSAGATRRRGRRGTPRNIPFTIEENEALIEKFIVYYSYLSGAACKRTNQSRKNQLWRQVTDAVNAMGANARTVAVVKKRYFDIKRQVRRKVSKAARAARASNGGPLEEADLNSYEQQLYDHLGPQDFMGIEGGFDADAPPSPKRVHLRFSESDQVDPGAQESLVGEGQPPQVNLEPVPSLVLGQASQKTSKPPQKQRSKPRDPGVKRKGRKDKSNTVPVQAEAEYRTVVPVDSPVDTSTPGTAPAPSPAPRLPTNGLQYSDGSSPPKSSQIALELLQEYHRQNQEQHREVVGLLTEIRDGQQGSLSAIKSIKCSLQNINNTLSQMLLCKQMRLAHDLRIPLAALFPGSRAPKAQQAESDDEQSTD